MEKSIRFHQRTKERERERIVYQALVLFHDSLVSDCGFCIPWAAIREESTICLICILDEEERLLHH